jgi:hypothetical protein
MLLILFVVSRFNRVASGDGADANIPLGASNNLT